MSIITPTQMEIYVLTQDTHVIDAFYQRRQEIEHEIDHTLTALRNLADSPSSKTSDSAKYSRLASMLELACQDLGCLFNKYDVVDYLYKTRLCPTTHHILYAVSRLQGMPKDTSAFIRKSVLADHNGWDYSDLTYSNINPAAYDKLYRAWPIPENSRSISDSGSSVCSDDDYYVPNGFPLRENMEEVDLSYDEYYPSDNEFDSVFDADY